MPNVDIFKSTSAAPQNGEFFKFTKIGDGIQGTYVDRREGKDGYQNDQVIYVLKDKEGKLWNAAFRASSIVIHERMKNVKLGQIVGFKYDSDGTVKRGPKAGTTFRIINPYADPKLIDKEWLAEHPDATLSVLVTSTDSSDVSPVEVSTPQESEIEEASLKTIIDLARSKGLGFDASDTDREIAQAVQDFTELELTDENVPKIIIKLTTYKG